MKTTLMTLFLTAAILAGCNVDGPPSPAAGMATTLPGRSTLDVTDPLGVLRT